MTHRRFGEAAPWRSGTRGSYRRRTGATPDNRRSVALAAGSTRRAVVAGTDGALWATAPEARRVVRAGPSGDVQSWATETAPSATATWSSGRLWFAEQDLDRITGIAPDGDRLTHPVPKGRRPNVVGTGPDGAVWFGSGSTARLGSVSMSGAVFELDLPAPDQRVLALGTGPGPSIWMAVASGDRAFVGHVTGGGEVALARTEASTPPVALSIGPDGRLWHSDGSASISRRTRGRHVDSAVGLPLHATSWAIGADDTMWVVDGRTGALLRISDEW